MSNENTNNDLGNNIENTNEIILNEKEFDKKIMIINKEINEKYHKIKNYDLKKIDNNLILSISIFPSNNLVCGFGNGDLKFFNNEFEENKNLMIKKAHKNNILFIEIKDENYFFTCSNDLAIKSWTKKNNIFENDLKIKEAHQDTINKIIYFDKLIISCSLDFKIKIWEKQNQNYQLFSVLSHQNEIFSILIIDNKLVSSGINETKIWDLKNFNELKAFEGINCYGRNGLNKIGDKTLIIGGNLIILISIHNYNIIKKIKNNFVCWSIYYCDGNLFIGGNSNVIKIYNLYENSEPNKIITESKEILGILRLNNERVVSYSTDKVEIFE